MAAAFIGLLTAVAGIVVFDRFENVKTLPPLDRTNAFRDAVATTRDEVGKTIERTKRWESAWDRATDKLIRGRFEHLSLPDEAALKP